MPPLWDAARGRSGGGDGTDSARRRCARSERTPPRPAPDSGEGRALGFVTAIHLYVTDLDYAIDFYTRLLGYGPQAAYEEGESAHSAFFVLEQRAYLVLTWDPDRGRETGGSVRLELAADDLDQKIEELRERGIAGGRVTRTRFGTDVYDLSDPDGHLIRLGPAWELRAIEGAV